PLRRNEKEPPHPPQSPALPLIGHEADHPQPRPARDTSLVPVAARLVRAVEGVVDVEPHLIGESGVPAGPEGTQ
ncbi:CBS domain-containing protein, partial [Streptomyces sp. NPDC054833]